MKRSVISMFGLLILASAVYGAPWAQTYPLNGTTIMLTNQQVNTVWVPVTVLWKFPTSTNATLIWRCPAVNQHGVQCTGTNHQERELT